MEATRGSDRVAQLSGAGISSDELDRLAGLGDEDGIDLVSWHRRGIPATDVLAGSFHTQPESAGTLVDKIIAGGAIGHVHVFPLGIPAVTQVQVNFNSER
jgi:hypothetical protein